MKAKRRLLLAYDIKKKSKRIFNKLIYELDILKYDRICTYVSSFSEPDTMEIISFLINKGKKVYIPVTDKENISISLSLIKDMNFTVGAYGIPEPRAVEIRDFSEPEIILVPGIAFDKEYNRIGFGMGYYDRFLNTAAAKKVGICYDFQIAASIPCDTHDIKMDKVVTDKQIF